MEHATTNGIMYTNINNTPLPGEVAHEGPISAEVSSSHGGIQRNGDHYFLRGEE